MRNTPDFLVRLILLGINCLIWWWAINAQLSDAVNLSIIIGGALFIYPLVWFGRLTLDKNPGRVLWITTFVHYSLGLLLGLSIIRAVGTYQDWPGWVLPVPTEIGLLLVIITSAAGFLAIANLALKGLGAPFAIALSQRLAVDWMYAWTRNPMVLAGLALFLSLGIWFQSVFFVLWALLLFNPALLFFVKVYEERELELRFGAPYLEYKARTPMLFPRKPGR